MGLMGASLRLGIDAICPASGIPLGTLIVNIIGSFSLVLVYGVVKQKSKLSPNMIAGLGTGFLGSFTTISGVCGNAITAIQDGSYVLACENILLNMIVTFLAAMAAMMVNNMLLYRKGLAHND